MSLLLALALVPSQSACGPSRTAADLPAALTCEGGPLPGVTPSPLPLRPRVPGGQTDDAKRAKKLFDAEKWPEASLALARVASGETGDDLGNQQIAAYSQAVALYRLADATGAATIFMQIARDRSHLRHGETLLWISKIAITVPSLARALVFYTEDDITKYDNADQKETYYRLAYLMGRERLERGLSVAAASLFARVSGELRGQARVCLAKAKAAPPQPL